MRGPGCRKTSRGIRPSRSSRAMIFDTTIEVDAGDPERQSERRAAGGRRIIRLVRRDVSSTRARAARKRTAHSGCRHTMAAQDRQTASRAAACISTNLSVSIIGGSQPGPIRKLADAGEDDGLLQRFLPIMVRPAVGGRDEAPGQAVHWITQGGWRAAQTRAGNRAAQTRAGNRAGNHASSTPPEVR